MHGIAAGNVPANELYDRSSGVRPLDEIDQALLSVLDAEPVSTSVVRNRARLKLRETAPELSRAKLTSCRPIAIVYDALRDLERRGLVKGMKSAQCIRWRRVFDAD